MENQNELYEKYALLLPGAYDGGYLIIALYGKIKAQEIQDLFTITDIRQALEEIGEVVNDPKEHRTERILKILLHYFLRNNADDPGKYYLTDYARNVVELMKHKLENPYKNFPLKESFEKSFIIKPGEIKEITDLEQKFGRIFIEGPKKVINDHLEALEDELYEAYHELNAILQSDEKNATALVRKFSVVFKKFGDRAEDITNSIVSKDRFLRELQLSVDYFYHRHQDYKQPENEQEHLVLLKLKNDWESAITIYNDIDIFFRTIDFKTSNIRGQIFNASEKLSELQEQFSSRSHLRLRVKRLLQLALTNSIYNEDGPEFETSFPLKGAVHESTRLFYPEYYEFLTDLPNYIIEVLPDKEYEQQQQEAIKRDIDNQEIVNQWVTKTNQLLADGKKIELNELIEQITTQENNFSIAYQVAGKVMRDAAEDPQQTIKIKQKLISLKKANIGLWKTSLEKSPTTRS